MKRNATNATRTVDCGGDKKHEDRSQNILFCCILYLHMSKMKSPRLQVLKQFRTRDLPTYEARVLNNALLTCSIKSTCGLVRGRHCNIRRKWNWIVGSAVTPLSSQQMLRSTAAPSLAATVSTKNCARWENNRSHTNTQSFHSTLSTKTAFSYKQNKHAAVSVSLSHFLVPKQGHSTRSAKAAKPYKEESSSYGLQYPRPTPRKYMTTIQKQLHNTKYFYLVWNTAYLCPYA